MLVKSSSIIIAEAGVNHNGDLEMAKELVRLAAEAGADYVKFQTFSTEKLVTKTAKQAAYQKKKSSKRRRRQSVRYAEKAGTQPSGSL